MDPSIGNVMDKGVIDEVVDENFNKGGVGFQGYAGLDGGLYLKRIAFIVILVTSE